MLMEQYPSFLKWPGGKRWLAPALSKVLRQELTGTYFEPFLGAASVFLELAPSKAVLSDINGELIATLETLRTHARDVVTRVWMHSNTAECYYQVRSSRPRTPVGRAARFLYLNRTCWGGVYRTNQNGDFNVPFGNSGRSLCSLGHVMAVSNRLVGAELRVSDFEAIVAQAVKGDVVYADPPYTTRGENNGFVRYNERLFSWQDQIRLALAARSARRRGAFVAVSGLLHKELLKLYPGWLAATLSRTTCVSRASHGRREIHEALIVSRLPRLSLSEMDGIKFERI